VRKWFEVDVKLRVWEDKFLTMLAISRAFLRRSSPQLMLASGS
jgi:hypothetical protein